MIYGGIGRRYIMTIDFMRTNCKRYFRSIASPGIPSISQDFTHHVWGPTPAYNERFKMVQSFHPPLNVAAVETFDGIAYHIDIFGHAVYLPRFLRAFGFYQKRAAVSDDHGAWYHIDIQGRPIYSARYSWCGNYTRLPDMTYRNPFVKAQAPVRTYDGEYFLIDEMGNSLGGPYLYCGDPNSQGQSVVWSFDGTCTIVNLDGSVWGISVVDEKWGSWMDARAPHKGIASVKDSQGWFFVNSSGRPICGEGRRFAEVEDFYNGQARVRTLQGLWAVVDEQGRETVALGQSAHEASAALVDLAQSYQKAFALKDILTSRILIDAKQSHSSADSTYQTSVKGREVLLRAAEDLGLCAVDSTTSCHRLTTKGEALYGSNHQTTTSVLDKCVYWLQDRYIKAWCSHLFLPEPKPEAGCHAEASPDIFRDISGDKECVELSQRVLAAYAIEDWTGIVHHLPVAELATRVFDCGKRPFVIADLGGGTGSLLSSIGAAFQHTEFNLKLICMEREEVVNIALADGKMSPYIDFMVGDLFHGPILSADLYLMTRVLHDWDDERALRILQRVCDYAPPEATLCVVDRKAGPNNTHAILSLHMYKLQRSFERTEGEWDALFMKSGWRLVEQKPFAGHFIMSLRRKGADIR